MDKFLKYLSFRGRANRSQFWLAVVILFMGYVSLMFLAIDLRGLAPILSLIVVAGILVLAYASLANMARRLHDRNKSAWWLLLYQGVPALMDVPGILAGGGAKGRAVEDSMSMLIWLVETPLLLWVFVDLGFLRGVQGPNKYGDVSPEYAGPHAVPTS